jgi:hypothetical protein
MADIGRRKIPRRQGWAQQTWTDVVRQPHRPSPDEFVARLTVLGAEWMIWLRKVSACAALLRPQGSGSRTRAAGTPDRTRALRQRPYALLQDGLPPKPDPQALPFSPSAPWRTPAMEELVCASNASLWSTCVDATRGTEQCRRKRLAATSSSCLALFVI